MKKLMVSTIILLPLLILLIMLVSGAIMSLVTHIYVEQVEFVDSGLLKLVLSDEQNPPSAQCEVNIFPLQASNRDLIFESDDESVVTVDDKGVVTAKYFGETYISVTSEENKAATAKRKVFVTDNKVHAVKIQPFTDNLYRGDSQTLTAKIIPNEAEQSVTWSSSNPDVLKISATGILTCEGAKPDKMTEVTITATSVDNPEISDSITIHCYQTLDGISLEGSATEYTITGRETQFPTVIPSPSNATYTVEYSSDNEALATVDANGKITFTGPGYATITVTASDIKEHVFTKTVSYHCTDGYFEIGSLFPQQSYTVDYDETLNHTPLSNVIKLNIVQGTAYRQIVDVTIDRPDLIEFNKDNNTFSLKSVSDSVSLGNVHITVHAKKYNKDTKALVDTQSDKCTVTVTRKAQSIKFVDASGNNPSQTVQSKDVTFAKGNVTSGIGIIVTPANHTDTLVWDVKEDEQATATFTSDKNTLTFSKEGTVTVVATIVGNETVVSKLPLTYTVPKAEDKPVKVGGSNPAPQNITLKYNDKGECGECILDVTPPEGMKAVCESDNQDVIKVDPDTLHLIPQNKGGFAEITVNFVAAVVNMTAYTADESVQPIKFKIYVDKPVGASDVEIAPTIDFTQNESVGYTVTFKNVTADALAGKEVTIDGVKATMTESDGLKAYTATYSFQPTEVEHDIKVTVSYTSEAEACNPEKKGELFTASHKVKTTHGKLADDVTPTVKVGSNTLAELQNTVEFGNIGEQKKLDVTVECDPADFVLTKEKIKFSDEATINGSFTVEIGEPSKQADGWHVSLTLTSKKTMSDKDNFTLTIAGQDVTVGVKINALAQKIELSFSDKALSKDAEYNTLLKKLALNVKISRNDENEITDKSFKYTLGSNGEQTVNSLSSDITLALAEGEQTLTINAGTATFTIHINRVPLSELKYDKYHVGYPHYGEIENLDDVDLVAGATQIIYLPKDQQGAIDVCVKMPTLEDMIDKIVGLTKDNILAGFDFDSTDDSELSKVFKLEGQQSDNWSWKDKSLNFISASADGQDNIVKFSIRFGFAQPQEEKNFSGKILDFTCNGVKVTISLNCASIARIDLIGFDSENKANGGDVYKGYQQVRVFAKQSDYGNDKGKVDYFRMPVSAISDTVFDTMASPNELTWTFTEFNFASDNNGVQKQLFKLDLKSKTFKYDGVEYEIVPAEDGPSTLQVKNGAVIAQGGKYQDNQKHVPWIDVHWDESAPKDADKSYVDIYFGEFKGLSETDIQNDLFGNFAEEEGWTLSYDHYDLEGKDVTPSDGAFKYLRVEASDGSGGGKSAHFNFNVLEDSALVNVFNATGYYNQDKIVLHNNLYGGRNENITGITGSGSTPSPDEHCNENELTGELYNKAKADDLVLDKPVTEADGANTPYFKKTTVYGNGYQINLNALNTMIIHSATILNNNGVPENSGYHTQFTNIYNVNLKGRNDTEKVISTRMGVYFGVNNAYYSTIQNYGKLFSGSLHAKNTIFRNAAMAGIELWSDRNKTPEQSPPCIDYLENVTIVNARRAIIMENHGGHTVNIKGYFDALNYYSFNELKNLAMTAIDDNAMVQIICSSMVFNKQRIDKYMEWFGRGYSVELQNGKMDGAENFFVNPMIIDVSNDDGKTKTVNRKQGNKYAPQYPQYYPESPNSFYIDAEGNIIRGDANKTQDPNIGYWTETGENVGGVGGIITVWDANEHKYVNIKDNPEKSSLASPLSGLDHFDPRFNHRDWEKYLNYGLEGISAYGNKLITAYTLNTPNTVDGGYCDADPNNELANDTYSLAKFAPTATRPDLGKLFTNERDIRLLCEYIDIDDDGNPILNTDHILWHMQKAHRNVNLITERTQDHSEALKESLKNAKAKYGWDGEWPDGTTLQDALDAEAAAAAQKTAQAASNLLSSALPERRQLSA